MAIYKLIANGAFGPDEIKAMTNAYENALIDLHISNRDDPITELIAKSVVNVTATGERDPKQVMERALNALGVRRSIADSHEPATPVQGLSVDKPPEPPSYGEHPGAVQTPPAGGPVGASSPAQMGLADAISRVEE